jgi:hypothetical protein
MGGRSSRSKRSKRSSRSSRSKRSKRSSRKRSSRKQRGGFAPIHTPNTLLHPLEQAKLFLYPQYDDMRHNDDFLGSRTPLLNTAIKFF